MRTLGLCALMLGLAACEGGILDPGPNGDTDDTADTADTDTLDTADTDDTGTVGCGAVLTATSPSHQETNVAVNKVVTARFSAPVYEGEWSLAIDGVTGTAELGSNGLTATFVADAPLDTSVGYTLRATVCDIETERTFTTASGPLDEESLEGRTYAIAYDDLTWVEPAGIGALIGGFISVEYLLVSVIDLDTTAQTIHMAGALGVTEDGTSAIVQDLCQDPFDFGDQDFAGNPVFEVGPSDIALPGGVGDLSAAYVKAAFVEDGEALVDFRLSGQLDVGSAAGFLCGFIGCATCLSNPTATTCVDVQLLADRGEWVDGLTYDPAPVCPPPT